MGFFNGCLYFSLNNIWVFPNCTAPETENTQAAFVHIGILRFIKQCSPRLTCTGIGKFLRIPMPIVTIEFGMSYLAVDMIFVHTNCAQGG